MKIKKILKNLLINTTLLIFSVLLFFLCFEALFRSSWIDFYSAETHIYNQDFFEKIINNNTKIICLGDSFTGAEGNKSYPNILDTVLKELGLNVDVINLGVAGTGPKNYYYRLKTYVDQIRPQIITIGLDVGSDFFDVYHPTPISLSSRPYYFISDYFLVVPYLNKRLAQIPFFSYLKGLFTAGAEKHSEYELVNMTNVAPRIESRFFRIAKDFPDFFQASVLVKSDFSKKQLELVEEYLLKLKKLGDKYNSKILLIIIPISAQVNAAYYPFFYDYVGFKIDKDVVLSSQNIQNELKLFAEKNNIVTLDLLPYLKGENEYVYYFNDIHLNENGHNLTARILADKIVTLLEA